MRSFPLQKLPIVKTFETQNFAIADKRILLKFKQIFKATCLHLDGLLQNMGKINKQQSKYHAISGFKVYARSHILRSCNHVVSTQFYSCMGIVPSQRRKCHGFKL